MTGQIILIIGLVLIMAVSWFWMGYITGARRTKYWWQDEMIRRRHAVYHWENGKWYWNEDEPKTPRDPAATKVRNQLTEGYQPNPPSGGSAVLRKTA